MDSYYFNVVEEINEFNDWCISDNNSWGIPIPFFKHKESGNLVIDPVIVNHFAKLVEEHGSSDIWYTMSVEDLLPAIYRDKASEVEKEFQVFDSWFDSSLSWQHVFASKNKGEDSIDIHTTSPLYQKLQALNSQP